MLPPLTNSSGLTATVAESDFDRAEIDALIHASVDVVLVLDRDGRYLKIGAGGRDMLSRPADELLGKTLHEVLPLDDAERLLGVIRVAIDTGETQHTRYRLEIDNAEVWFEGTVAPTGNGTVVWAARDLTAHLRAQEALDASESGHRELLASLPIIVYWVSPVPPYNPIYVSPGAQGLGYTREEWMQPLWLQVLHPDDRDRIVAETEAAVAAGVAVEYEYRVVAKDGTVRWMHDRGDFVHDERGRPLAWRGVMLDVTERRALQDRVAALSEEDELTGLLNRRGFRRMALQALKVEQRSGRRTALLYFDLDGFKAVNDGFGHAEGDRALRTAAQVLRAGVRDGDIIARIGGDEFVVLAAEIGASGQEGGRRLAERVREQLTEHEQSATHDYRLEFSVGVVEESGSVDLDRLLQRADAALYADKTARRSRP